jgi:N-acetylglucosamine kinase-like BadF-type ATPase
VFAPLAYAAASADGCVVHVHGGLAGISIPGKREPFQAAVRELLPDAKCDTSTDALVAAWGAFAGRAGVAVLAGTGSIALAGAGSAYPARTGGYGYLLGDEGSGF